MSRESSMGRNRSKMPSIIFTYVQLIFSLNARQAIKLIKGKLLFLRMEPIVVGNARTTPKNLVLMGYQVPKGVSTNFLKHRGLSSVVLHFRPCADPDHRSEFRTVQQ